MSWKCGFCGSMFCNGQCMASTQQQAQQQIGHALQSGPVTLSSEMERYQRALQQIYIQQNPFISQPPLKPAKPLPEEREYCATGGLIGWRSWRVPRFGGILVSLNKHEWPIRQPHTASCKHGTTECRGVHCDCGIYAWKKRENLKVNASEYSTVDGEVWLWGEVIEHTLGYRAEFAYPKALVNSGYLAEKLAKIYGVPLLEK